MLPQQSAPVRAKAASLGGRVQNRVKLHCKVVERFG